MLKLLTLVISWLETETAALQKIVLRFHQAEKNAEGRQRESERIQGGRVFLPLERNTSRSTRIGLGR